MRYLTLLLSLCLFVAACSDDDDAIAPAYVTTLGEIMTDAQGKPATFIADGGSLRQITSSHKTMAHDSTYRVMVRGIYDGDDKVQLTQIVSVLSPMPRQLAEDRRKYDPADVLSLWSSGRYINMHLALHTATEPHAFAFIEEGVDTLSDDTRRLRLHLYHDQGNNPEYYTREAYISCPIYHYAAEKLRPQQDSILFTVTTYKGERTLRMRYDIGS